MSPSVVDTIVAHSIVIGVITCRTGTGDLGIGKHIFASNGSRRLNVKHNEFNKVRNGGEGVERLAPVDRGSYISLLKSHWVKQVDSVAHSGANGKRTR